MRNYSRFIPGEEIDAVEQWSFVAIDTAAQLLAAKMKALEEANEQAKYLELEEQGYKSGYKSGFEAGVIQGHTQAQTETRQKMEDFLANQARLAGDNLTNLLATAQTQVAEAEQAMAHDVLALSCELARQVLRHELAVNPQVLLPVVREALELLGIQHKSAVVRMNPADVTVLQDVIRDEFLSLALTLVGDPTVSPGGCLVESAGTVIDGTVQKRWQRAIANLGLTFAWEEPYEPNEPV